MLSISASNGGGFVPVEEVAEALGMFQLRVNSYAVHSEGKLQQLEADRVWEFTYKGRVWRAQLVLQVDYRMTPAYRKPVATQLHFDYLRQA